MNTKVELKRIFCIGPIGFVVTIIIWLVAIKLEKAMGIPKMIINPTFKKFAGKIVNIHPSLLPKYKGLNTHQKALKNNDKYSGCTVHYVTDKIDSGKIILQKKLKSK